MSSRTRVIVMSITAPVVAFAILGGFLGKVMAREDTYQHLKIFDDVVSMISNYYVEEADIDKVMRGAMHGLADALDPDSAYLTPAEVKQVESAAPLPPAGVGVELTRQYYLRVIAARDNSPAAKAGLRTGDYIRAINDMPTREMSVWEGIRALRGAPGTKVSITMIRGNAADPIAAASGDGAITLPAVVLVDTGTSGAAEIFASAIAGNQRADLIGEHTIGRAASQKLIRLPDGAGLWLSTTRYLTPAGAPLHEKGLEPTVPVDEPDALEFGQQAPTTDPIL